ncbi:MAG: hypothetical protein A3D92_11885 [Bacteroidetes bacterium RIFCSPHIGHO2_02_FULL_44_7]|nr:MAG: hypothetical protein A3D92_11885 [Bacteroidetes bacterium RIFCSPHIGHO2_02_FULL_44_7]
MADIKFTANDEVVVEAFTLKTSGADFVLDYAPRKLNNTPFRRALVHDFQDGLTLNWANDYPGGITLNGNVNLSEVTGTHFRMHHHDLIIDNASRRLSNTGERRALVHDISDGLTVNWGGDYPGGVTIRGAVKCPQTLTVGGHDVMALITQLQNRVNDLEARVTALES